MTFEQWRIDPSCVQNSGQPTHYDPALESLPSSPWYALNHRDIAISIREPCDRILAITKNRSDNDTELCRLDADLQEAREFPSGKEICVALLGDLGVGKSSRINELLGRDLVRASSGSLACTSFATIITYKKDAADDTSESDLRMQFLSDEEIGELAAEQARRYRAAFPPKITATSQQPLTSLTSSDGDSDEADFDEPSEGDIEEEEVMDIEEKQHISDDGNSAKEFFKSISRTGQYLDRMERALDDEPLEDDCFYDFCIEAAKQTLASKGAAEGLILHKAVADADLDDRLREIEDVSVLVKSIQVETGHTLLRNNVRFLDVPGMTKLAFLSLFSLTCAGYGDRNHMRTALIDKFRGMADFEVVVGPCVRSVSSKAQNTHLQLSTRRLGPERILLVANRADVGTFTSIVFYSD